jgi:hypothetical protein
MMEKSQYRLGHYRITEYETGLLWWETHFEFGRQRGGEGLICGNILLISPWSDEKDGLLIGEFLDQLKKLPPWNKTLYYCFTTELLEVKTGRNPTADFMKQLSFSVKTQQSGLNGRQDIRPGPYRIDRYRITVNDDRTISWQTPDGKNRIMGGKALIESGILFLGPMVGDESKQNKQEFLFRLSRVPQWTGTSVWCRHSALRSCRGEGPIKFSKEISTPSQAPSDPISQKISGTFTQSPQNGPKPKQTVADIPSLKSIPSFSSRSCKIRWPKWSWPWTFRKKIWLLTGLILLVITGLAVTAIIVFYELEEKDHRPQWFEKNHHEHGHEHHNG